MVENFIAKLMQGGVSSNNRDRDLEYIAWQQKVNFFTTINNYSALIFLVFHPIVMVAAYDFWANYHFLLVAHSLQ